MVDFRDDADRRLPISSHSGCEDIGSTHKEIWVEIFKKSSKRQTVTFDGLLDVAICYGWIDVQTQGVDEHRYAIRFVPRKPGSNWSEPNRERVKRLQSAGRMQPEGIALLPPELLGE